MEKEEESKEKGGGVGDEEVGAEVKEEEQR